MKLKLDTLQFVVANPCYEWCKYGVRDPSVLLDPFGKPVVDQDGCMILYFNGRNRSIADGGTTAVGMAVGNPIKGWRIFERPVFSDGLYAAQGSVISLPNGLYIMYYSPNTARGFFFALSRNLVDWERSVDDLLLCCNQFRVSRMGLPYVTWVKDRWHMVFEGIRDGKFRIFMAASSNGIDWEPLFDGEPIYDSRGSWDSFGQANPSLYYINRGRQEKFVILYNGCSEKNGWELGCLTAQSPAGPWVADEIPFLRRDQLGKWAAGRLEGPRYVVNQSAAQLYFFGLPSDDSYSGGSVACVHIGEGI